jgi:hypothetical protein
VRAQNSPVPWERLVLTHLVVNAGSVEGKREGVDHQEVYSEV